MKRSFRILAVVLAACVALSVCAYALEQSDEFYVNDAANILSSSLKSHICEENYRLYETCGAEVVVVTVDFIEGYDMEDYAYSVFNDWELGDPDKDNGVLIVVSPGSDKVWIMPGDGIRNDALTPEYAQLLCDRYLIPALSSGKYDDAVRSVFDDIVSRLDSKYGTQTSDTRSSRSRGTASFIKALIVTVLVIVLIIALLRILTRSAVYSSAAYRRRRRTGFPVMPNMWSQSPRPPHSGGSYHFGSSSHHSSGSGFSSHSSHSSHSSSSHFGGGSSSFSGRVGGGGHSHGGGAGRH